MKRTMYFLMALCLTAAFMTTSCKKGDTGPQGEQGEQGDKGDKGDAGSANVIYSAWTNITIGSTGYTTISAPKLTNDILNNGDIRVYANLSTNAANPVVVSLPYREVVADEIDPTAPDLELVAYFAASLIEIDCNYQITGLPVRYVLIPGGVNARKANIDWNNYAEVKKFLNLKD